MSKQSLLLVDGDTRSLRVLEVSLRKAGFSVTPAATVKDALDKLELHTPDLIISETSFPSDLDGFELRRRVRALPDFAEIPFIFLTAETTIENKIRGLELGVDDYLTKPIYIKEIVTRINILLQRRQRRGFDEKKDGTRFAGRVTDMPVVDVIQTIEISRKSGVINFTGERGRQAAIYFRDGRVIDAEAGTLQGEDAVYRLLTWNEGEFEVMFRTVRRREVITASSQGLLMEGMRRLDEWSRLLEQLPPLSHRFEVDSHELSTRLGDIPDDNNRILRLIDGKRSLIEVVDASDFGDLECLQVVARLYFEGLLIDLDPHERARRDTGKPMPFEMVDEGPPSIKETASGPEMERAGERRGAGPVNSSELKAPSSIEPPGPPPPAQHTYEQEEPADVDPESIEEETAIPGPLMGGYRPSSLMLIDAAVAAAEAIEPSLFEDAAPATAAEPVAALARVKLATRATDPRIAVAQGLVERNAGHSSGDGEPPSIESAAPEEPPRSLDAEEPPSSDTTAVPEPYGGDDPTDPSPARRFAATIRREESGLRMIGSLGRDRAEASGELAPTASNQPDELGPQRELVTIMPRRATREMPTVQVAEPAKALDQVALPLPPPAARVSVAGGVSRSRGPGSVGRWVLIGVTLLTMGAVYMKCHHTAHPPDELVVLPASSDAGVANLTSSDARITSTIPHDAGLALRHPKSDAGIAVTSRRDASVEVAVRHDASVAIATTRPDASTPEHARPDAAVVASSRDGGVGGIADKTKEARDLMDKAHDAVEEGDYAKAVALADASIKLRKTARTYIIKAQALQRLSRNDEALKSIDGAMEIVSDYAPAWELRGMILWSAHRKDEARAAMTKYLALDPNGKSAPAIRRLLQEPK